MVPTALELGLSRIITAAEVSAAAQVNFKAAFTDAHAAAHAAGTHAVTHAVATAVATARRNEPTVDARPRTVAVPGTGLDQTRVGSRT